MWEIKDLTGQRFGRWIVKELVTSVRQKGAIWRCVCDCGEIKDLSRGALVSGRSKSCGCYKRESMAARGKSFRPKENLIGMSFGDLKVVGIPDKQNKGQVLKWICECVCGNKTMVDGGNLKNGSVRSCGCFRQRWIQNHVRYWEGNNALSNNLNKKKRSREMTVSELIDGLIKLKAAGHAKTPVYTYDEEKGWGSLHRLAITDEVTGGPILRLER